MDDLKRSRIAGKAIPVRGNDIDTDRIIPARFLRCVTFDDLGAHAFEDDRAQLKAKGQTHSFDQAKFDQATVLLVNKNFGCGSSREHAPQAIMRWGNGIKALVGESFAEIFFGNCVTLGVPCVTVSEADIEKLISHVEANPTAEVAVDVEKGLVSVGSISVPCHIADGPHEAFLKGTWDSTAELLAAKGEINATASKLPYFNGWK